MKKTLNENVDNTFKTIVKEYGNPPLDDGATALIKTLMRRSIILQSILSSHLGIEKQLAEGKNLTPKERSKLVDAEYRRTEKLIEMSDEIILKEREKEKEKKDNEK